MSIMLTETLCKNSEYFNRFYEINERYEEVSLYLKEVNSDLLYDLLNSEEKIYIKTNDTRLNEIIIIVEYYQLNNVILKLNLNSITEYKSYYDEITKDITINCNNNDTILIIFHVNIVDK